MKGSESEKYIFICTAKSCKKNGSKTLVKELKKLKKDKKLKVLKTKCMDDCKKGPNVVFDGQIYHRATVADVLDLLKV